MISSILKYFKKPQPNILIFAGAGLSAESGLSTFRDSKGLWNNYDLNIVCNIKTFVQNKEDVFKFYNERKREILKAQPNAAHKEIALMQKTYGVERVQIFTSNIDDLLERAGCTNVCHVHGDMQSMNCVECNAVWEIGKKKYDINAVCPQCQSKSIKPNIVFFNEVAPKYKELNQAFESSGIVINKEIKPHIKLLVGTSFAVIPLNVFKPGRSHTILVDNNELVSKEDIKKVIIDNASSGVVKAHEYIKNLQ